MAGFPKNKTIKELGIDTSKKFRLVGNGGFYTPLKVGDLVELVFDDNTSQPRFRAASYPLGRFIYLHDLEYADDKPEKVAIHCPTLEIYKAVVQHMLDKGWYWMSGRKDVLEMQWGVYGENTSVSHEDGMGYSHQGFFESIGYTIKTPEEMGIQVDSSEIPSIHGWSIGPSLIMQFHGGIDIAAGPSVSIETAWEAVACSKGDNEEDNLFSKPKNMGIVQYVKNLGLSKEEKLLREEGLKNECGEYAPAYKEIVLDKLMKENEAYVVEMVEKRNAEEDK